MSPFTRSPTNKADYSEQESSGGNVVLLWDIPKKEDEKKEDENIYQGMIEVDLGDTTQLPSIEEYKAQTHYRTRRRARRPVRSARVNQNQRHDQGCFNTSHHAIWRMVWIFPSVALMSLVIAFGVVASQRHQHQSPADNIMTTVEDSNSNKIEKLSLTKMDDLEKQVMEAGWTTEEDMANPDGPQIRALEWIVEHDDKDDFTLDEDTFRERYAAIVFYFALSGADWDRNGPHFLQPNVHICNWFVDVQDEYNTTLRLGIDCSCRQQAENNTSCDQVSTNGVKRLILSHMNLQGILPREIRLFTVLELLNLDDNQVQASVDIFQDMTNLKALFMSHNSITGQMSHELMKSLPNLHVLDLSQNNLTGIIPRGVLEHPNLAVLDLHANHISGEFPSIFHPASKLEYLSFRDNDMEGSLSPTLLALSESLTHLDLAQNSFTGPMPKMVGKLVALEYLDLSFNDWDNGEIPFSYGQLQNLKYLALQDTNREGFLPYNLMANWFSLETLDLGRNNLVGYLPESLSFSPYLKRLVLYHNEFMGTLDVLNDATQLEIAILNGGNAWDELFRLNDFCNKQNFPFLETLMTRPCTNNKDLVSISPYCSCCTCCPNLDLPECDAMFSFSNPDSAWDTEYVKHQFRSLS